MFGKPLLFLFLMSCFLNSCVTKELEEEFGAEIVVKEGDSFDFYKPIINEAEFKLKEAPIPLGVSSQNKIKHLEVVLETVSFTRFKAICAGETRIIGTFYNADGSVNKGRSSLKTHVIITD